MKWGYDALKVEENAEEKNKQQLRKLRERYLPYAKCFGTEFGLKVLADLEELLEGVAWNPEDHPNFGYYREGQKSVLRHIKNAIKKAEIKL